MDYKIEELSAVKRQVNVTVPAEEVNASIGATIAIYRKDADIKGFRKGKVPGSIIESKFRKQIYGEATNDLINYHINDILNQNGLAPVNRIDVDAAELVKDEEFTYSFSFEVTPKIDLPEYTGLAVEEEDVVLAGNEVDDVIERIRDNASKLVIVEEVRKAQDGDVAVIDFEATQNGVPVEGISAQNFELPLGQGGALSDFEDLVKQLAPGESGEQEVTFPEDFINDQLAGQTVVMKASLHALKSKKLPEIDEDLAQLAGGYDSVEQMREMIEKSYIASRKNLTKSDAQKKLLDGLKEGLEFELPPSMVESNIDQMISEMRTKLEQQGKNMASLGKTPEELREEYRENAEDIVKSQLFLLAVADKEEIEVTPQEVDLVLQKMAASSGYDFNAVKDYYEEHNLLIPLRDKVRADKAMDLIYEKAEVSMVAPKAGSEQDAASDQ